MLEITVTAEKEHRRSRSFESISENQDKKEPPLKSRGWKEPAIQRRRKKP